jgi:cytoskeletal protein RodZ
MEQQRAFGSYLRSERELRQIPLAEIAKATKIPIHTLENLENGRWDDLPAEVFVRGFVKSYARHVGISAEDANSRYGEILDELHRRNQVVEPVGDAASEVGGRRRFGVALFVLILLIIATITLSIIWRRGASADTDAFLIDPPTTRQLQGPLHG